MSFKPKSRSMVLGMERVTEKFGFFLEGIQIWSVNEKSIESLGKVFTLRDTVVL